MVIGCSFSDDHINKAIADGVERGSTLAGSLQCASPGFDAITSCEHVIGAASGTASQVIVDRRKNRSPEDWAAVRVGVAGGSYHRPESRSALDCA